MSSASATTAATPLLYLYGAVGQMLLQHRVIYPFLRSRILPPPPEPGAKENVSLSPRQQRALFLLQRGHLVLILLLGAIATGSAAALLALQVGIRGDLAWYTAYIVGGFTLAMCVACWLYMNWQERKREQQQKQAVESARRRATATLFNNKTVKGDFFDFCQPAKSVTE